jgi:hypothetical protein
MFSFHSSYSWMKGKKEAQNWPVSRQDASLSSWTILVCVGLNATFRDFHTLQHGPSLPGEGIPGSLKEGRLADQVQTFWMRAAGPARSGTMSEWRYLSWVSILLTILLDLTHQGPHGSASSSSKVSSSIRGQSSGVCEKSSSLGWEE